MAAVWPLTARAAPSTRLLAAEHDAEHVGLHDVDQIRVAGLRQQAVLVRVRARVIDPGWCARPSLLHSGNATCSLTSPLALVREAVLAVDYLAAPQHNSACMRGRWREQFQICWEGIDGMPMSLQHGKQL